MPRRYGLAFDAFRRAIDAEPPQRRRPGRAVGCRRGRAEAGRRARVAQALAGREPANAPARVELSRVLAAGGDFDGRRRMATEALRLTPDDPRAGEQLASIVADAGDADRLQPLAESLAARFPDRPEPQYYRATALFLRDEPKTH